jgi:hypothetical protein
MAAPAVIQINLVAGGPSVHVTVWDQNGPAGGNMIQPGNINWDSHSELNTIGTDPTGFNFSAVSRGTPVSFMATATDNAQNPPVTGQLTVNIVLPPVTALTFSSP